jgi:hypothetical protein
VTGVQVEVGGAQQVIPIPRTRQELDALRIRRSDLSDQLTSAVGRRNRLADGLDNAEGASRVGMEQRLALLDRRILQLEGDIAATGQALTLAPAEVLAPPRPPERFVAGVSEETFAVLSGMFTVLVLFPLAFALARLMWRRAKVLPSPPGAAESAARLERIEQAVDAIAIEIERVSEGQRYTTRLLTEAHVRPALGAGQGAAEPLRAPDYEAVRMRREGTG